MQEGLDQCVSNSPTNLVQIFYDQKKQLTRGMFTDREYNADKERECPRLRPILKTAKEIDEYKFKSKLEENHLVIKGKT